MIEESKGNQLTSVLRGNDRKMDFKEDSSLSEQQKRLKWSLYCEIEFEKDEDIKAVLMSLLEDQRSEGERKEEGKN